jgi:hypothetical protein
MNIPDQTQPGQTLPPLGEAIAQAASSAPAQEQPTPAAVDAPSPAQPAPAEAEAPSPTAQPVAAQPAAVAEIAKAEPIAAEPAATTEETSINKVKAAIEAVAEAKGPSFKVLALPLIAALNLPEDPDLLDSILTDVARMVLTLRSDAAATAEVVVRELAA